MTTDVCSARVRNTATSQPDQQSDSSDSDGRDHYLGADWCSRLPRVSNPSLIIGKYKYVISPTHAQKCKSQWTASGTELSGVGR